MGLGDFNKAWYCARQAVLYGDENSPAAFIFFSLYDKLVRKEGLDTLGVSYEEVISQLGCPDIVIDSNKGFVSVIYGLCVMEFQDGKLIKVEV